MAKSRLLRGCAPLLIGLSVLVLAGPRACAQAPEEREAPKLFPDFKEVTEGMKPTEGLFTLYRYDPQDKNRETERLLCQIPRALLEEDMLFATSISRGGSYTGWMWNDYLVRWEIVGKVLKMVTPDMRYILAQGKPVTEVVERTYNETFIATVPILTMSPSGDPVIDLGALLKSDLADIAVMGPQSARVRAELSKWAKVKVFPDNVLIDVDLALGSPNGAGAMVGVAYAFRRLPKLGAYKPRPADDRVGYFLTARVDWSKGIDQRDTFERYINRWNLEKRDPSLELSPPKRPITFVIEKTVPIQWRRWIRQGIEEWNRAFEKIGFVDAIVVQQQTDDNEFADYDPEDARYNFFRWIVSGEAFAMGPSRTDPRTGEILDADIIMDDSMVRAYVQEFDVFGPSTLATMKGPGWKEWTRQFPELVPPAFRRAEDGREDSEELLYAIAEERMAPMGQHVCTYARGLQHQVAFVHSALLGTAGGKKIPERFLGEVIREVVTHEVGHTLGLRHNFKGSSWLSLDDVKQRRNSGDDPLTASIMDYNPVLFFAGDDPETVRHFTSPAIGPYDEWAIEFGYRVPADGDKSEADMLKEIARRCTKPELAYATDEDTVGFYSPDPMVNRWDVSGDPVAFARSRIELCDKLTANITEWGAREGEPRYQLRQAFDILWFEKARNFEFVGRLIGGQQFHRDHVGDPDARPAFVLTSAAAQRDALALLGETLLCESFFQVSPDLLNQLAPPRWSHWGADERIRLDYPIHDRIALLQLYTLSDIASPVVLQRIYDAELKSADPDKFTAAELITRLRDHVWGQLDRVGDSPPECTNSSPFIGSISRNLQREYLDLMLSIAQTTPGSVMSADLHGMLSHALRELSAKIGCTLDKTGPQLDFASRAHLIEARSRIDRVLAAQFTAR